MKNQESKKKMLIGAFTFVMAFGMTNSITASSWRIGASTYMPHFTSISEAMSSENVQDGDTLYLDPGISLASSTVTKAVTIVGTGYFLSDYAQSGSSIAGLNLNAENIKVEGCGISGTVNINSPNICLERCYVNGCIDMNNQNNTTIKQCYIHSTMGATIVNGENSTIENNIIRLNFSSNLYSAYKTGGITDNTIKSLSHCIIRNNYIERYNSCTSIGSASVYKTFYYAYVLNDVSNCEITNNIILNLSWFWDNGNKYYSYSYTYSTLPDCTVYHNLFSSSENSLYPYNKNNQSFETIFLNSGSNDKVCILSASSPAKGYATDGGDCGPYGGSNPYVASGLPFGHPYNVKMNITLPDIDGILKVSSDTRIQNQ